MPPKVGVSGWYETDNAEDWKQNINRKLDKYILGL